MKIKFGRKCYLHLFLVLLIISSINVTNVFAQDKWPAFSFPSEVITFDVGGEMTVNGTLLKVTGIMSTMTPERVAQKMRGMLQQPNKDIIENKQGSKIILSQIRGDFLLIAQIEPAESGSKGFFSINNLQKSIKNSELSYKENRDILKEFPNGSQIFHHVKSKDIDRSSQQLLIVNHESIESNSSHVVSFLKKKQFTVTKKIAGDKTQKSRALILLFENGKGGGSDCFFSERVKWKSRSNLKYCYSDVHIMNVLGKNKQLKQRGQASLEYVIVCAAIAFALFVPIQDDASSGQAKSAIQLLIGGFREGYAKYSYSMSLPE